ncbi:hypothetical protein NDU88_001073 [Pleurodeles waltl]|uniref:Uncharacterized protein n=1 Tax=Pleurodeles waltl TaxID=8319 RepID=A0AAV7KSH2_PLEWA|nr:hypothetical protein NDU88_001073 [Pleurodeles waltl]
MFALLAVDRRAREMETKERARPCPPSPPERSAYTRCPPPPAPDPAQPECRASSALRVLIWRGVETGL